MKTMQELFDSTYALIDALERAALEARADRERIQGAAPAQLDLPIVTIRERSRAAR